MTAALKEHLEAMTVLEATKGLNAWAEYVTVTVTNGTPADWEIRIIEIGSKFWYQDEKGNIVDDEVVSKPTSIDAGQSDSYSGTKNGCCRVLYTAVKVLERKNNKERIFDRTDQVTAKECIYALNLTLGPKYAASRSADLDELIELISR